jgi:hypothetical protein
MDYRRHTWLLRPLQAEQMRKMADDQRDRLSPAIGPFRFTSSAIEQSIESITGRLVPESRSQSEYGQQVEAFLEEARPVIVGASIRGFLEEPCCRIKLLVENPTERNMPGVELNVTLGDEV